MGGRKEMPDIRLQDYTAKIRDLMQVGRHDEAVAHCQHILRHYPKHIETYGLLGEACLEKGMYREAIEFFQRTLSADPENLIARVGLGIIYDEQGALPEAVWQMERAFELAPGNTEVRQELQRLYAQRDGVEKSRLKLTRGALGRLCSRNGLYDRAINEFRAVLRQDPDLPDIRVAFAEALWREGRRLEAVETCQSLLDELPNCLKANLILGEIWMRGGHEDAGEERLELARALDPEGRIAQEMMGRESPLSVEEIDIPELKITPDLLRAAVILEEADMPVLPEWEEPLEEGEWIAREEVPELAEPWDMEGEMPDWLREVGIAEEEPIPEPEDEALGEEVAVAAQVPDWLQELVEEEAEPVAEAIEKEAPAPEEIPEWLREIEMEDLEEEVPPAAEAPEEELALAAEEAMAPPVAEGIEKVPEWMSEPGMPEEAEAPLPEAEELAEEAPAAVDEPEPVTPEPEIPTSLRALVMAGILSQVDLESAMEEMSSDELEAQQAEAIPDWLQDLIGEETPPVMEGLVAGGLAEEVPDWLREFEEEEEEEEITPSPVTEAAMEEVELVAEVPEEEIEPVVEVRAEEMEPWAQAPLGEIVPTEELPDWLRELGAPLAEEEVALPPAVEEAAAEVEPVAEVPVEEAAPVEEFPDWLRELGAPLAEEEAAPPPAVEEAVAEVEPVAEVPVEEAAPVEELPDWLRDLGAPLAEEEVAPPPAVEEAEEEVEPVAEVSMEEAAPVEELPDWLRDLGAPLAEEEVAPPPAVEEVAEEVEPVAEVPESLRALVEAGILDESDLGAAMAEMSPEELEAQRAEAVPDWLQGLIGEDVALAAEEAPVEVEGIIPPLVAKEVVEEVELVAEMPAEEAAPVEELPDGLLEPVMPVPEPEVVPPPVSEEPVEEIEWMVEIPVEEVAPPLVAAELVEEVGPVDEVPESLRALVEAGILDESDLGTAMAEMSPEELEAQRAEAVPDWLQSLLGEDVALAAEEAPVEVEEVIPPLVAEEVVEEVELVAEMPAEEAAPVEELPDWLLEPAMPVPEPEVAPPPAVEELVEEIEPEEVLVVEEEIALPAVEELVETAPLIEEIAVPPQVPVAEVQAVEGPPAGEAPVEEAPAVEEVAAPTELEMVAPYERVEIEEEVTAPARLNELLAQLQARPRDYAARLELARLCTAERDWDTALDHYEKLISARRDLPAVIDDLTSFTQEEVDQARVHQVLGDAYMQSDHLDKALEMYRLARQALTRG
jgi:tetratricopeptide (TPR) repeat protein